VGQQNFQTTSEHLSADFMDYVSADKIVGHVGRWQIISIKHWTNNSAALPISADNQPRKIEHALFDPEKSADRKVGRNGKTHYR